MKTYRNITLVGEDVSLQPGVTGIVVELEQRHRFFWWRLRRFFSQRILAPADPNDDSGVKRWLDTGNDLSEDEYRSIQAHHSLQMWYEDQMKGAA